MTESSKYEGLHLVCATCGCYGHLAKDCKVSKSVQPASKADITTAAAPVEGTSPIGGGVQVADNTGNLKTINEDPGKGGGFSENVEQYHGDWLVNLRGPSNKIIANGPVEDVGPNVKPHAFKMDSGKHRRHDKSTPTHVLLKNVGKDVYVNPIYTGTPNLSTDALLAPQGVFSSVPRFRKEDLIFHPPPDPPLSSPMHSQSPLQVASPQPEDSIEMVPDSQVSQSHKLELTTNAMLMHE
ncbi:hypothetical protein RIF29_29262 [Crotalaria pallida]|uniref:CCHC-type domain-containing protein n=1 Tax=Crotalaria pallida TaxID=3830 RepID=A0AAN9EE92_CROPI